jgi:polyhydroxyalkanoate synthesis regulator phasin
MDYQIVSDRQLQRLNRTKNMVKSINTIDTLETQLRDMKTYFMDILDCKNSDNSKEFLQDIMKRISAIDTILNV